MDVNMITIIVMAIVMTLVVGFFDALAKQLTTGVWDYGYLVSLFIYSVIVGFVGAFSGLLNLTMPLSDWQPILATIFASYFAYLTIMHTVADYIIAKLFPTNPQGLATPFLKPLTKMQLSRK
jgi:hypothetical protein